MCIPCLFVSLLLHRFSFFFNTDHTAPTVKQKTLTKQHFWTKYELNSQTAEITSTYLGTPLVATTQWNKPCTVTSQRTLQSSADRLVYWTEPKHKTHATQRQAVTFPRQHQQCKAARVCREARHQGNAMVTLWEMAHTTVHTHGIPYIVAHRNKCKALLMDGLPGKMPSGWYLLSHSKGYR